MSPVCNPRYQWAMLGRVTTAAAYRPCCKRGPSFESWWSVCCCREWGHRRLLGGVQLVSEKEGEVSGGFWSMAFRGLAIKPSSFP